ncbi:Orotidine 5'-phosphate decarboxylase [Planctomycetes bacterium Poly30]|uniref:Orotidine 5'-phosphate decarboxylase n=1 Tax=Saltatorellus ferox TaxID=2528018 RepID=A0A518F1E6_9BACT|nr:Orotidine 5'-phosphate decarboxylase [Planctomycetes bacterium Poly30]
MTSTSAATYADRLHAAVERTQNPSVIGLDPHLALLPDEFAVARDSGAGRSDRAGAMRDFLLGIVEVAAGKVPAVKPQSAFFEVFGADGVAAFEDVVAASKDAGLLVIGDVKRGDIGSTAAAYAESFLTGPAGDVDETGTAPSARRHLCDAATVNPYLGSDSITPFLDACEGARAGLYVLVRTSNPSSAEFQTLAVEGSGDRLADRVADAVHGWGAAQIGESGWSSIGAVVGATHPDELQRLRRRMPRTPLLLPGYGAQGASAEDIRGGFSDGLHGALVNSSRGILYAGRQRPDLHWKDAAAEAIDGMAKELRDALLP